VRIHQESTARQYALTDRALELGWAPTDVDVIDDDQGQSGRDAQGRLGFQRLLSAVSLDQVGIIFGIEMSRLARSNKDWHHLLELCAIFRTLLADQDGMYDPADYNDRLLLGLKGTMSEAELHILRGRMYEAKLNKARRGELCVLPPMGYVKGLDGRFALDPDEQAQSVVRLVFDQFDRLGTLRSVVRYLTQHGIRLPIRPFTGPLKGQLEWRPPRRNSVRQLLTHPIYAGFYRYGCRQTDPRRRRPGQPQSGRVVVPAEQYHVLIPDRCPAYISQERYRANQLRLETNRARSDSRGAPREGSSWLAGLVICGRCQHHMTVQYAGRGGILRYRCTYATANCGGPQCQDFVGRVLDEFVAGRVLAALEPAALELSLQAADDISQERGRLHEHWQQRLERASYEATRVERQYQAVEPENRLVARQLEQRWEEGLQSSQRLQRDYAQFCQTQPAELTAEERSRIMALAQDLPRLWNTSETTSADRQCVIRQLIERVVVHVHGRSERMDVSLIWAGGFISQHQLVRPVLRYDQLQDYDQLVARIEELQRQGASLADIAGQLNREGFHPVKQAERFDCHIVGRVLKGSRRRRGLPTAPCRLPASLLGPHEWIVADLAARLGIPKNTLHSWLRRGWIHYRRVPGYHGRCICWVDDDELQRLLTLRAKSHNWWDGPLPIELTTPKSRPPH
jgi:DNA invertase Pin-like site-specific DNA recombinase/DNA-binding transcriptional MerR regulator